jgi:hypothetical protein
VLPINGKQKELIVELISTHLETKGVKKKKLTIQK